MAKRKLLIAALLVGLFAAFFMYLFAKQIKKEKDEVLSDQVAVVKAARLIPSGTELTKEKVTTELVPRKFLPPNPLYEKDLPIYLDSPVAVQIDEGAMILTSDFSVAEVSRTLSAKIPEDERALSVAVDAISGVSGLLKPGDRVDILGTFPHNGKDGVVQDERGNKTSGFITMTLLQNVTLLAVGNRISDIEEQRQQQGYSSVTISVTVQEAELLTITQTRGKLVFLLRNREDVKTVPNQKATLAGVLVDLEVIQKTRKTRTRTRKKKKPVGVVIENQ